MENQRQTDSIRHLLLKRVPPLFSEAVFFPKLVSVLAPAQVPALYKAGLHLWNDDLERCHEIVQAQETPTANYWHAILHRREKEFANSNYWYARVGNHPVLAAMKKKYPDWDPLSFNERCEREGENPQLEKMQADEMHFLLDVSEATIEDYGLFTH